MEVWSETPNPRLGRLMAYRLTDRQTKVIAIVDAALAEKKTPQIAFFWRKLRAAALPKVPPHKRGLSVPENALIQVRWQRGAALASDSHVAAQALLRQEIELLREISAQASTAPISVVDAHNQLTALVEAAPQGVQYRILQDILTRNPQWATMEEED